MVPWECVRSGIPALCSNGCIQCRALEKINEEGDVYYHEKLEFILEKKTMEYFPEKFPTIYEASKKEIKYQVVKRN